MKKTTVKTISFILKMFGYAIGTFGCLLVIGSVGSFSMETITAGQLIIQELLGFLCIGMAFVTYIGREAFKYYFI